MDSLNNIARDVGCRVVKSLAEGVVLKGTTSGVGQVYLLAALPTIFERNMAY